MRAPAESTVCDFQLRLIHRQQTWGEIVKPDKKPDKRKMVVECSGGTLGV
jgi:hypothetical protein